MPPKPRWLLAIPDAISQLEKLDRTLLTRRDIERLYRAQSLTERVAASFASVDDPQAVAYFVDSATTAGGIPRARIEMSAPGTPLSEGDGITPMSSRLARLLLTVALAVPWTVGTASAEHFRADPAEAVEQALTARGNPAGPAGLERALAAVRARIAALPARLCGRLVLHYYRDTLINVVAATLNERYTPRRHRKQRMLQFGSSGEWEDYLDEQRGLARMLMAGRRHAAIAARFGMSTTEVAAYRRAIQRLVASLRPRTGRGERHDD